jgi:hypothetical protein
MMTSPLNSASRVCYKKWAATNSAGVVPVKQAGGRPGHVYLSKDCPAIQIVHEKSSIEPAPLWLLQ